MPGKEVKAFLGLGSNVGNRVSHLQEAVRELAACEDIELVAASAVYESEAHTLKDAESQSPYLNAVAAMWTHLSPHELLEVCLSIERQRGRRRKEGLRWEPRTLDIDILAYGAERLESEVLTIPHPRLGERAWVLRPWADIAPSFCVPHPYSSTVAGLLSACMDTAALEKTPHVLLDS